MAVNYSFYIVMSYREPIINVFRQVSQNNIRALVFGGGLAFAIPNGYWHHTPLILLNPIAYAGYQTFIACSQELKDRRLVADSLSAAADGVETVSRRLS